jgi:hypothetical protein
MTTEFPRTYCAAMFLLAEAANLGIAVGTNGDDIVALMPAKLPSAVRRAFEAALEQHRAGVIEVIQQENVGGLS